MSTLDELIQRYGYDYVRDHQFPGMSPSIPSPQGTVYQPKQFPPSFDKQGDFKHIIECPKNSTNPKCKEAFAFLDVSTKSSGQCKKWYIAILVLAILTLIFGCYCACRKD